MASLLLLHTCESDGTAQANASYLVRIGAEPHWVFDPRFGVEEAIHLVPYTEAGKALRNLDGGVETNRREQDNAEGVDVIQVEIVGYAAQVGGYDDAWYRNLRTFLLEVCAATGVPYVFPRRFAVRYGDDGVRCTPDEWNDPELVGIVGHCHAPENDHWDPGDLDLSRLTAPQELDVQLSDTINIKDANAPTGRNDAPVSAIMAWTIEGVNELLELVRGLGARVADLEAQVATNAPVAGDSVDYARLAAAVSDMLAARLAS
jgi:hypothetical protein